MSERVVNFSAGPGALPLPVLEEAQRDLVSLPGVGASALEVSHRGAWFRSTIEEAEANLRELLAIPEQGFSSKASVIRSLESVRHNVAEASEHTEMPSAADSDSTTKPARKRASRTKKDE